MKLIYCKIDRVEENAFNDFALEGEYRRIAEEQTEVEFNFDRGNRSTFRNVQIETTKRKKATAE